MSNLQNCLDLLDKDVEWDEPVVEVCALLSNWIYDPETLELPKNLQVIVFVKPSMGAGQITCFAAVLSEELKTLFVVHRGTVTGLEVAADGFLVPHLLQDTGIKVHAGFYTFAHHDAWRLGTDFRTELARVREQYSKVRFTGHSLGGAVAMLLLMEHVLGNKGLTLCEDAAAIVFGSPMVLHTVPDNKLELVKELSKRTLNFVNGNDAVPRLFGLCEFVEDKGSATVSLVASPPWWYQRLFPTVARAGQDARDLAMKYKHHAQLAHLKCNGQVERIDEERLNTFCPKEEANTKNSIYKNHDSVSYLANVIAAAQVRRDGADDANIVARLQLQEASRWVATQCLNKYVLSADVAGIFNIRESIGDPNRLARVVSFCGNMGTGKSFIIKTLQQKATPDAAAVPCLSSGPKPHATTGDVALWHWGDDAWLLDSEGTMGTDLPTTMNAKYRNTLKGVTEKRSAKVEEFFPPLCICLSSVFCYVIEQVPTNMKAYTEVCKFASAGWDRVESAVRPGLVIIQNKVEASMLGDPEELTESFKELDAPDKSKPEEQRLKSLFLDVYVVQLPAITEQNKANKSSDPKSQVDKTVQELFDDRVALLEEKVKEMIAKHLALKETCHAKLTQSAWLKLMPAVCMAFKDNGKVNVGELMPTCSDLFRDVVVAARMLLSRARPFQDPKDMEEKTLAVLAAVKGYTACLMAQVALAEGLVCSAQLLRQIYGEAWLAAHLDVKYLLPCSAVCSDQDVKAPYNICGLPGTAHDWHKSSAARDVRWFDVLWGKSKGAKRWKGEHELSDAVKREVEELKTNVFDRAVEIMQVLMRGPKIEHRRSMIQGLKPWVKTTLQATAYSSLLTRCFVCGMSFEGGSFLLQWLRARNGLEICDQCSRAASPS